MTNFFISVLIASLCFTLHIKAMDGQKPQLTHRRTTHQKAEKEEQASAVTVQIFKDCGQYKPQYYNPTNNNNPQNNIKQKSATKNKSSAKTKTQNNQNNSSSAGSDALKIGCGIVVGAAGATWAIFKCCAKSAQNIK